MFQAYFESIKYVGHLLPISLLRVFLGYFYINQAYNDWKIHILSRSTVSDLLVDALASEKMPYWYRLMLTEYVMPNWSVFAFVLVGVQFIVGISYILGYVVRPTSVLAIFLCLNFMAASINQNDMLFRLLIVCHVLLAWVGAGRCLGLDYYFYKRYRGMWW